MNGLELAAFQPAGLARPAAAGARGFDAALANPPEKKAMDAARDFEAMFLRILLSEMRSTVVKSGLFGKGLATDIYEDMLFSQIADTLAAAKPGTGVKETIYNAIIRSESVKNRPDSADNSGVPQSPYGVVAEPADLTGAAG